MTVITSSEFRSNQNKYIRMAKEGEEIQPYVF